MLSHVVNLPLICLLVPWLLVGSFSDDIYFNKETQKSRTVRKTFTIWEPQVAIVGEATTIATAKATVAA